MGVDEQKLKTLIKSRGDVVHHCSPTLKPIGEREDPPIFDFIPPK